MEQLSISGNNENEAIASFLNMRRTHTSEKFSTDRVLAAINDFFNADRTYVVEKNENGKLPFIDSDKSSIKTIKAPLILEAEVVGFLVVENPREHENYHLLLTIMAGSIYKEILHAKESSLIQELRRTRIDLEYINKTIEDSGIGIWGIFDYDKEAPQMVANPKMIELLGLSGEKRTHQEVYQHWYSRIVPEYEASVQESVREMIAGTHSENTYMWNHPTKGRIYVRCGGMLSTAKSGTKFLSGYHSDVTEIILKEQETQKKLEFAMLEAQKANEARAEFLSRMSHDIRTPLNGIIGLLEISRRHPDDQDLIDANRTKMQTAANHLLSLVNDVLNLNKLECGKVKLAHEAFSLKELADDVLTIISMRATEEGLVLEHTNCEAELKYPCVYGSPLHVRQILLNIMGNAIKYNKAGGTLSCKTEFVSSDGKQVVYRVTMTDTGIGMSKEFLERIFEPFSQERIDARSTYQGTGLGMTITKSLIDLMNGTLEVKSELGKGSTFTVTVPFDIASEEDIPQKANYSGLDITGKKILLVEDNTLNQEIAKAILDDMGADIVTASNGKEALNTFKKSDPEAFDLILMDIMMPVMNGYEATKEIRALPREDARTIPIIAMTANAFEEDRQRGKEAGMNAHLSKPINIQELIKELGNILG